MTETVIAVDPGQDKCGVAVVHKTQGVLLRQVIPTGKLAEVVAEQVASHSISTVVLGDGTTSRQARAALTGVGSLDQTCEIVMVDERYSTEEARRLYWRENPPRGIRRLLPVSMQLPPVPVDGYVAGVLAERYFRLGGKT